MGDAEPRLIDLRVIPDPRGALTVGENLPFAIRRFFFLSSGVRAVQRGGHAHKELQQILLCTVGKAFADVWPNGKLESEFVLERSELALYLPPMTWLDLTLFARSTVLVLASAEYDESDYIRSKEEFDGCVQFAQ